jgi:Fe-S-cluster containining protein
MKEIRETDKTELVFECQRGGACCRRFSWLTAHTEDIERWMDEGREDILQYADMYIYSVTGAADLWFHPETGEELPRCPFLRKVRNKRVYECEIYDTRPMMCRGFPHPDYNEDGELIGAHAWAVESCPGIKALLKDWTPERVQALRDGKMMKKAIVQGQIGDPGTEPFCAWCEDELYEGAPVYLLGVTTRQKATLEGKESQLIPLALAQKTVRAFVAASGSDAKRDGWDLVLVTCGLDCARSLQAALRQETDLISDVSV